MGPARYSAANQLESKTTLRMSIAEFTDKYSDSQTLYQRGISYKCWQMSCCWCNGNTHSVSLCFVARLETGPAPVLCRCVCFHGTGLKHKHSCVSEVWNTNSGCVSEQLPINTQRHLQLRDREKKWRKAIDKLFYQILNFKQTRLLLPFRQKRELIIMLVGTILGHF